ncbi:DUF416 family protein [Alteromonas oceanisediminis]|uniref:DUF416 family protein n=1 Tax=Alteromonas oceanisediminis TaxID=2836180 RepID=UPI001BD9AABA|nr:DUF416 family protein [Alteromonas oceanisediminis]MBT0587690.1 DUF416 family protein [Alteromonas oceanisediminis]
MNQKLTVFAQVRELPLAAAVGFCATMLERQLPNFKLFCEVASIDDESQMSKALAQVWLAYQALISGKKITTNMALLREKVELISPHSADHDNFGVYPAIDCAMSMVATLNLLAKEEDAGAVVVSKLSQGSVELVILATEGDDLSNEAIKAHPLMQREVDFQQQLLAVLNVPKRDLPSVEQLQQLAHHDGASNIGIEP